MKVVITGKVLKRAARTVKDGERYDLILEEPGQYPNVFRFSTKDKAVYGPADGFAAVGKTVTVTAYLGGAEDQYTTRDGKPGVGYRMWLKPVDVAGNESADSAPAAAVDSPAASDDDYPF